jgi:histidyl-tRNA synthetase
MTLSTQPYKGARDFYPEDKRLQKYVFSVLRKTVEQFGYQEYDAPILEPLELYLAKTGEEIVTEQTYTFEDRGGRQVAIRPEMTPSVSRMVAARRQELAYPLRWYSLPNLWRYERPQRGRLREHWQLNVDLFGIAGTSAEFEMITLLDQIMKAYGAKHDMYSVKLNSREFINYVLGTYIGLDQVQSHSMSKLIDRMHKIDRSAFIAQAEILCSPSQREQSVVEKLLDVLDAKRFTSLPAVLQQHQAVKDLQQMIEQLQAAGLNNVHFDPTLMRGFDYYTGIVFEIFDTDPENNRSMFGGGRYDGLVGLFGVDPVPTVGFGMGDVTLANFLESHKLLPDLQTETDLYIVLVGDIQAVAQKSIAELRAGGLNVAVDLSDRKIDKQIKTADKKGIHYIVTIGEQELASGQYPLKNLLTGEEEKHSLARIISTIEDYRHRGKHNLVDDRD